MKTEILSTHTPELFQKAVRRAAELLRAGEVVALPTETVYGLAANALDGKAVAKIFEIKGRPAHNPIIVHVASNEMAGGCAKKFPMRAEQFSKAFWPGPLTLVLPRAEKIPENRGRRRRDGGHSLAVASVHSIGDPRMRFSAVRAECQFIEPDFADERGACPRAARRKNFLIVDGGQSQVGIESTVLDLTVSPPKILRPGMIHAESLAAVGGENSNFKFQISNSVLRSPGLLAKHYSPKAKLLVLNWRDDAEFASQN